MYRKLKSYTKKSCEWITLRRTHRYPIIYKSYTIFWIKSDEKIVYMDHPLNTMTIFNDKTIAQHCKIVVMFIFKRSF